MSFQPHYAVGKGSARFNQPDHPGLTTGQRPASTRDKAIEAAARCFGVREYEALVRDIDSGRVDIRLYDDGLVLTWNH